MSRLPVTDDYFAIAAKNIPLIDVRAPVEYAAGAFPEAVNLPLMDDEDRHLVGICYKQHGREAAFTLAHKRVSGAKKTERIARWQEFCQQNPHCLVYCFRGGMRSKTAQKWLAEHTGLTIPRLQGGYKGFRRYLLEVLQPQNISATPVILGGRTGTGKTLVLRQLDHSIDLEAIANHRGSAFGGHLSPQPSQIDFENRLAYALIAHQRKGYDKLILEDEGSYIGARYIPHELAGFFRRDSMVLLESSLEERVEITYREYVTEGQAEFASAYPEGDGLAAWLEQMKKRVYRIRKRLGGERYKKVVGMLNQAHESQLATGIPAMHKRWIEVLLHQYYDPMYDYQIKKSGRKIDFQGDFTEVLEYLRSLASIRQAG